MGGSGEVLTERDYARLSTTGSTKYRQVWSGELRGDRHRVAQSENIFHYGT